MFLIGGISNTGLTNIKAKNQGFTIVELLIVVVVVAILAAITIVSYNGITNRANTSAAASLASTLAADNGKTTLTYTVCGHDGSTTPPTTIAGISTLTGVSIQYFNYEGTGNKTVTLGTASGNTGTNARGCVIATS